MNKNALSTKHRNFKYKKIMNFNLKLIMIRNKNI